MHQSHNLALGRRAVSEEAEDCEVDRVVQASISSLEEEKQLLRPEYERQEITTSRIGSRAGDN